MNEYRKLLDRFEKAVWAHSHRTRDDATEREYDESKRLLLDWVALTDSEPVGVVGSLPGTSGFTMAAFEASKVPVGTRLYTESALYRRETKIDKMRVIGIVRDALNACGISHEAAIVADDAITRAVFEEIA